jgi:hypothetical protein
LLAEAVAFGSATIGFVVSAGRADGSKVSTGGALACPAGTPLAEVATESRGAVMSRP